MSKKEINQFVKAGDVQGIIIAHELEAKRKNAEIERKIVPLFNELSIIQRNEMKRYIDKGQFLGIPESVRERLNHIFRKTSTSANSYLDSGGSFRYYASFNH